MMNPETTDRYDKNEPTPAYQPTENVLPTQSEDTGINPAAATPVADNAPLSSPRVTSPGIIVLQWLTYAFWGWTILALLFLVGMAASYSLRPDLTDSISEQPVAYGIAAVLVLLPISFICDVFYSRRENVHKHGAAMVIMVIHTVIFALLGIASLITIAFSVVSLLLGTGDTTGPVTAIVVAASAAVLYVLTLLRTVRPFSFKAYRLLFRILMLVAAIAIATWGILGPVAQAARTKDDRMVSSAMQVVYEQINSYTSNKNTLPTSLEAALDSDSSSNYSGEVSRSTVDDLVRRQLITYTRDTAPSTKSLDVAQPDSLSGTTLYYTLCATYKYDHKNAYYGGGLTAGAEEYNDYYTPYAKTHAGKNCYKLKTTVYSSMTNDKASAQATTLQ